jgi:hypothetical protein
MKHLKTYETHQYFSTKYKPGDFIKLDLDTIRSNNKKNEWGDIEPHDLTALILKINRNADDNFYRIDFYDGMDDDFYLISDIDILRLATPDEIEDFYAKKDAKKYNL